MGTVEEQYYSIIVHAVSIVVIADIKKLYLEDTIMNDLFETIAKIIADRTDRDIAEIKPESTFEELGIDSLDTVELLMNLEDEIGIEIELDQKVETINDLVKFIESKQE